MKTVDKDMLAALRMLPEARREVTTLKDNECN